MTSRATVPSQGGFGQVALDLPVQDEFGIRPQKFLNECLRGTSKLKYPARREVYHLFLILRSCSVPSKLVH